MKEIKEMFEYQPKIGILYKSHKLSLFRNEPFWFGEDSIKAEDILLNGYQRITFEEELDSVTYVSYQDAYITVIQDGYVDSDGDACKDEYIILHTPEQLQELQKKVKLEEEKFLNAIEKIKKEGFSLYEVKTRWDRIRYYEFGKFISKNSNISLEEICQEIKKYDEIFDCICTNITDEGLSLYFTKSKEELLLL